MAKTVNNKKDSEIKTPEVSEMGPTNATESIKEKLAIKLGYKKNPGAAPFSACFKALKKK